MPIDIRTLLQSRISGFAGQNLDPTASPTFAKVTLTGTPTQNTDAATKSYVDTSVSSAGGSLLVTDDESSNITQNLAMVRASSGTVTDVYVAATELNFNPDTGVLATPTLSVSGTSATKLSAGTTAQRPGAASAGHIRFNSDLGVFEGYDGSVWGNVGDLLEKQFTKVGTLSVASGTTYWLVPSNVKIVGIIGKLGTAPVGTSLIAAIKKNGATITSLTFVSGSATAENINNTYTAVKNDLISVDITQIGTSTAGADLNIAFLYERGT